VKTIGLVVNPQKKGAVELGGEIAKWLGSRSVRVVVEDEAARFVGSGFHEAPLEQVCESEVVIVLGGDGTILRVARTAGAKGTPMLGVHLGQYGFITEIHPPDVMDALARVLEGDYKVSERMMLCAELSRNENTVFESPALNDVVVSKGPLARLLKLHTYVDERLIATYAADGIIVSSPTGSTAYSLSAGGPVVNPDVNALIITPICPHTLNARSLVVPDTASVHVIGECGEGDDGMMLTVDGQIGFQMHTGDKITVRRAGYSARIVYWDSMSFYDKLQSRLRWGDRFSI